jgi:hypothetical protein
MVSGGTLPRRTLKQWPRPPLSHTYWLSQYGRVNIDAGGIAFVRVLGPIQVVTTSGHALDLPSASQRRLLARLAVDAPQALRDAARQTPVIALRRSLIRRNKCIGSVGLASNLASRR